MNILRIKPLLFFFVLLSLLQGSLKAQPSGFSVLKDTATLKSKLAIAAKETKTIQSDFVQEKNLSVLSEKIITKGNFYFKRENMLRWEYTDPFKYLIIMNKGKVLIKDDSRENKYDMQSNKMFQEINKMIVGSVQGKILTTGEFKYKFFQSDKYYLVELQPLAKNMKNFIKTIYIYFDKNYAVAKLNMEELSGDYTNITFANRKENVPIADEKFLIK